MYMLRLLMILPLLFVSSCSPFGNQSLIEDFSKSISELFEGESSKAIVAGATQVTETNAASGPNYKVSASVGEVYNQSSTKTAGGYVVNASIQ